MNRNAIGTWLKYAAFEEAQARWHLDFLVCLHVCHEPRTLAAIPCQKSASWESRHLDALLPLSLVVSHVHTTTSQRE